MSLLDSIGGTLFSGQTPWGSIPGLGGGDGGKAERMAAARAESLAKQQFQFQKDVATHGIQWRADDARAAGISPLVALGAQTFNPSPISAFPDPSSFSKARDLNSSGIDFSRAVNSSADETTRLQNRLLSTQIDGQEIDNAMKRSQLMRSSGPHVGPAMPSSNDGDKLPFSDPYNLKSPGSLPSQELANVMGNDVVSNVAVNAIKGWDNAKYFWNHFRYSGPFSDDWFRNRRRR